MRENTSVHRSMIPLLLIFFALLSVLCYTCYGDYPGIETQVEIHITTDNYSYKGYGVMAIAFIFFFAVIFIAVIVIARIVIGGIDRRIKRRYEDKKQKSLL